MFCDLILQTYFCRGEMAERSNAAVLKTVDCNRSGGSNPSLSASAHRSVSNGGRFFFVGFGGLMSSQFPFSPVKL